MSTSTAAERPRPSRHGQFIRCTLPSGKPALFRSDSIVCVKNADFEPHPDTVRSFIVTGVSCTGVREELIDIIELVLEGGDDVAH